MKGIVLIAIVTLLSLNSFSQELLPVKISVKKQAMSTPMTEMEEVYFNRPYICRPLNVKFDGSVIHMYYSNNETFKKERVTRVECSADFDDAELNIDRMFFVLNSCPTDTVMFVVNHEVPFVQLVMPTKNAKGVNIGYTSYKEYRSYDELALR